MFAAVVTHFYLAIGRFANSFKVALAKQTGTSILETYQITTATSQTREGKKEISRDNIESLQTNYVQIVILSSFYIYCFTEDITVLRFFLLLLFTSL